MRRPVSSLMLAAAVAMALGAGTGCQLVFSPDKGGPGDDVGDDGGDDGPDPEGPFAEVHLASTVAVEGLPVPIRLDGSGGGLSGVGDPTTDFRFLDARTRVDLEFEVEQWEPDGETVLWVLPQPLADGPNDELLLYYGEGAHGNADPGEVWKDGYAAVWHLGQDDGTGQVRDSTGAHHGNGDHATYEPGAIGYGRRFGAGGSGPVTMIDSETLFSGWSELTFELFIVPEEGVWLEQGDALDFGRVTEAPHTVYLDFNYDDCDCATNASFGDVEPFVWTYLAFTYDGDTMRWFRDGSPAGTDSEIGDLLDTEANPLVLGSALGTTFAGALDEIRVSSVHRSSAYVAAAYQTGDPAFVEVQW